MPDEREPLGGGYTLEILPDEDKWYGVLYDAAGMDVWETAPLADAGEVCAAARAILDEAGVKR